MFENFKSISDFAPLGNSAFFGCKNTKKNFFDFFFNRLGVPQRPFRINPHFNFRHRLMITIKIVFPHVFKAVESDFDYPDFARLRGSGQDAIFKAKTLKIFQNFSFFYSWRLYTWRLQEENYHYLMFSRLRVRKWQRFYWKKIFRAYKWWILKIFGHFFTNFYTFGDPLTPYASKIWSKWF